MLKQVSHTEIATSFE